MRRDSRAAPSTGCASSRTARTIRRRIRALRPAAEIAVTAADGGQPKRITTLGHARRSTSRGIRADRRSRSPRTRSGRTSRPTSSPTSTRCRRRATVSSASRTTATCGARSRIRPTGSSCSSERTFGTGMIIEKKLSHGGSDDLICGRWAWAPKPWRRRPARRSTSPRRGISNRTRRAGPRMPATCTSPRRRAARRTCSASRRAPARRSSRSRKASGVSTTSPSTRR